MPAVVDQATSSNMASKENKTSLKVLDDLMAKLTISKEQDAINDATRNLAIFVNGDIETKDAPTKYVLISQPLHHLLTMHRTLQSNIAIPVILIFAQDCRGHQEATRQQEGCQRP